MHAALYSQGKLVIGSNHGEAFSKLTDAEKEADICSGFVDPEKLKFISDDKHFYLKKILLIRHADSVGLIDSPITDLGKNQAVLVAKAIGFFENYKGFCSPIRRCVETANVLSLHSRITFTIKESLLKQKHEETNSQFVQRASDVLDELPEKSILVSHCDFIQVMIELATGIKISSDIPTCGSTYIENNRIIAA